LFDEQEDNLMVVIYEYVQGCTHISIEMHGKMGEPSAAISFENTLRIEGVKIEQKNLVRGTCVSILTFKKEMCPHVFHDPMSYYLEDLCNQNLQSVVGDDLQNERDEKSMVVLDMDFFIQEVSFQSELSFDLKGCYSKHFQHILHPFEKNLQDESPESKDAVEEIHAYQFMHVLEDPFAFLLETINNNCISKILGFRSKHSFLDELLTNRIWNKHVKIKRVVGEALAWLYWNFHFN